LIGRVEEYQGVCDALSKTLLIYEAYQSIVEKSTNNTFAKQVVDSWANADWFTSKNELPKEIKLTVFLSGLSIFLTSIDWACRGISGRDHASVAGDKSSVLISPSTRKTVSLISFGNSFFAKGEQTCNAISQEQATFLLGTMMGGYNITPLIELLDINATAQIACDALSKTL
jgi:aconitase B